MQRKSIPVYEGIEHFFEEDVLLTTKAKNGRVNIMPLTFKTIGNVLGELCISILVSQKRYTAEILSTGIREFTISRGRNLEDFIYPCGTSSGVNVNKINVYDIPLTDGIFTSVPVIEAADLSYECKLIGIQKGEFLDYDMYIGKLLGVFKHILID